jgi:hypothetical protein
MFKMRIDAGQLPEDTELLAANPALQLTAALMGLPSPTTAAAAYITKS